MNRSISIERILDYCDVPQLFIGSDMIGNRYLCLLFDDENEPLFLGIQISLNKLSSFLSGSEDLRDLFDNPELKNDYYVIKYNNDNSLVLNKQQSEITEEMLPAKGYYFVDKEEDVSIIKEVLDKKHPIIHLGFIDSRNSHSIPVSTLAALTTQYQSMVANCYKKLSGSHKRSDYKLNVFAYSAASFNVHMYAESELDIFGFSNIDYTLKTLDKLFRSSNEEEFMLAIKPLRGHTVKNYKNFIKELIDNEISVKYKWASSICNGDIVKNQINLRELRFMHDLLIKSSELESVSKEFEGVMIAANTKSGKWTLIDDNKKQISGESEDTSILNGVILKDSRYKITCNEVITINNTNSKEKETLFLSKIDKLG